MSDDARFEGDASASPGNIGGIRLGLDSMRAVLAQLGHPEQALRTISIAGTNGKGSTAAMVVSALRAADYRVGLFHSPSLGEDHEQIELDGRPIDAAAYRRLTDAVRRAAADREIEISPFETLTAVALLAFAEADVDLAVLEAGLGGARDATNVTEPRVSALVSVGFDHREHLGDSLARIATDKAGIFRPGRPAVVGRLPVEAFDAVGAIGSRIGADLDPILDHPPWDGPLGLDGVHQRDNAAVAVRILDHLRSDGFDRIDAATIARGLATCRWPGRLEWLDGTARPILLDAAHNLDGATALAEHLAHENLRPDLVFGAYADKDAAGMLATLRPRVARTVLVPLDSPRSWTPSRFAMSGDHVASDVETALADAFGVADASPILCAGSVFLVGAVRRFLI
ncbi:MAG: cyanophycin synthetase [Acidobacteriota bacterium]